MARTEPTTCTGCQREYDAPVLVAAFDKERLCPACEDRSQRARIIALMETRLGERRKDVAYWERRIAAHKAAHPPLVKSPEPEFLEMDGPMTDPFISQTLEPLDLGEGDVG